MITLFALGFPVAIVLIDNKRKQKKLDKEVEQERQRLERERAKYKREEEERAYWENLKKKEREEAQEAWKEAVEAALTDRKEEERVEPKKPYTPPTVEVIHPKKARTYSELLLDPRWRDKRLEILKRDNGICQYCGKQEHSMHVHHKYYMKYPDGKKLPPWNYPDDALITLCEHCHKWWHSTHKYKVYWHKYDNEYEY